MQYKPAIVSETKANKRTVCTGATSIQSIRAGTLHKHMKLSTIAKISTRLCRKCNIFITNHQT